MATDIRPYIRAATKADEARIRELVRNERLNPLGIDWRRFFVAEAKGEVVACVQTKPHGEVRELASLVVAPGWRGHGLGRQMVTLIQTEAGPPLWLTCRAVLISYYEACGFQEVNKSRIMPRYFAAARLLFDIVQLLGSSGSTLAVMVWRG